MTRESQGARRKPSPAKPGSAAGVKPRSRAQGGAPATSRGPAPKAKPGVKAPRVALSLTGKQKTYLRGLAHELKPVVQIGVAGLTDNVALQIDGALEIHELIKVKVAKEAPIDADSVGAPLEGMGVAVAQRIGRTVVLYRARRKDPTIRLPR